MGKVLLKPEEAALVLGIGRTQIFHLIRTGALRSVKIGASRRVPVTAVQEYLASLTGEAA